MTSLEQLNLRDPVLRRWINPNYLEPRFVWDARESSLAKPVVRYTVLDDYFNVALIDEMIRRHDHLQFNEVLDRGEGAGKLPYDGQVHFAGPGDFGADLFFNQSWHKLVAFMVTSTIKQPGKIVVKLRWHRADATGFWIHTDSEDRSLVVITYFNKGWRAADGGLLQLWRVDEALAARVPVYDKVGPDERLDFLRTPRLRTSSPGGGWWPEQDRQARDLILLDQIVPAYNRVFICDFQWNRAYHSVTPSNGRERTGFVMWVY